MRDKIFDIIEGNSESLISKVVSCAVFLTILVSCVAFVLESIPELHEQYRREFYILDVVVVMIFTLEYAIRFITVRKKWEHICAHLRSCEGAGGDSSFWRREWREEGRWDGRDDQLRAAEDLA